MPVFPLATIFLLLIQLLSYALYADVLELISTPLDGGGVSDAYVIIQQCNTY